MENPPNGDIPPWDIREVLGLAPAERDVYVPHQPRLLLLHLLDLVELVQ